MLCRASSKTGSSSPSSSPMWLGWLILRRTWIDTGHAFFHLQLYYIHYFYLLVDRKTRSVALTYLINAILINVDPYLGTAVWHRRTSMIFNEEHH
ncbi:hypothetical protein BJV82DRAFT_116932 [Fennellomyces sp. T-0311]|nr:hypothetical protein BJV82DRAFT_116932 [Fennellomyces sp. T-0311]